MRVSCRTRFSICMVAERSRSTETSSPMTHFLECHWKTVYPKYSCMSALYKISAFSKDFCAFAFCASTACTKMLPINQKNSFSGAKRRHAKNASFFRSCLNYTLLRCRQSIKKACRQFTNISNWHFAHASTSTKIYNGGSKT